VLDGEPDFEAEGVEWVVGELERDQKRELELEPLPNQRPEELPVVDVRRRSRSDASAAAIATLEGRERTIWLTSGCGYQLPPA